MKQQNNFIIKAVFDTEKGEFIEFKTLHVEGSPSKLAALLTNAALKEPGIKAILLRSLKDIMIHDMRLNDDLSDKEDISTKIEAPSMIKPRKETKSPSEMTDKELEDYVREKQKK